MMHPGRAQSGFTLLEILIATGLLAVGLVTIFTLFPIGILAVKDTVDGTRAASLGATARDELTAVDAGSRISDAGARTLMQNYISFGPWEYPSDVKVFSDCVYEYVDGGGVQWKRIVFDDRRMVPITLTGDFVAAPGAKVVTIEATSLNRDADRLRPLYDEVTGNTTFDPWRVYLRVSGRNYLITNVTYGPGGIRDLYQLTVDDPDGTPVTGQQSFQVLFPVALKEPPVNVPQQWGGGYGMFVGGDSFGIYPSGGRNLVEYLDAGSWISVEGDWYQVDSVSRSAGVPTAVTVDLPAGAELPGAAGAPRDLAFDVLLPVAHFGAPDVTNTYMDFSVVSGGGGGPQLNPLESGAYIEIMLDGARGTMDGSTVTITPNSDNPVTSGFIVPGMFIRVDGRDYEVATVPAGGVFAVLGTLPTLTDKYFNIVVGHPGGVSRFPVVSVTRTGSAVGAFTVGQDADGSLPSDYVTGVYTGPVHVMPRASSQFSYQVAFRQKSMEGVFDNTTKTVTPWSTASATSYSPKFDGVAYPLYSWYWDSGLTNIFQILALTEPTATGAYRKSDTQGYQILTAPASSIMLTSSMAVADETNPMPFHLIDGNDFMIDPATLVSDIVAADSGIYDSAPLVRIDSTNLLEDCVFLEQGVYVTLTDSGTGDTLTGRISSVVRPTSTDPMQCTLDAASIVGSITSGATVKVAISATDSATTNVPRGRGVFALGSAMVSSPYQNYDFLPEVMKRGFPYPLVQARRYHLSVGDYIFAGGQYYAVKAINRGGNYDSIILDRAYAGASGEYAFTYVTPCPESYRVQIAVFRRYAVRSLLELDGDRELAAAFGFDKDGSPDAKVVHLARPLPLDIRPGDYIRADGDADHPVAVTGATVSGLGDAIDGDMQWYMIDMIDKNRTQVTLTSPYRGYVPANETFQPASVTSSMIRTFDALTGAL